MTLKPAIQRALPNRIASVTADEAHLVLQWGETFRQTYVDAFHDLRAMESMTNASFVAMTGTLTHDARDQLIRTLGLRHPMLFSGGQVRADLKFIVMNTNRFLVRVHSSV